MNKGKDKKNECDCPLCSNTDMEHGKIYKCSKINGIMGGG
jgi:hypothetical protein